MNSLSNEEFQRNNITLNKWLSIEYYVCEITHGLYLQLIKK